MLVYFGAALVAFWPLLPVFDTHLPHFPAEPDLQVGVWFPWHVAERLRAGSDPFFAPELHWPRGLDLRLYVWNIGCALLVAPLHLVLPPIPAFNASLLLFATLNGLAGHVVGARFGGTRAAAVAAGLVATWAFEPLYELCAGRPEQGFLAPLLLAVLFLARVLEEPGRLRWAGALGGALGFAGMCYWLNPYLLALCAAPAVLVRLARGPARGALLRGLSVALGTSLCVAMPALLPVLLAVPGGTGEAAGPLGAGVSGALLLGQSLTLSGVVRFLAPRQVATLETQVPLVLVAALLFSLPAAVRRRGALLLLTTVTCGALLLALGPRIQVTPASVAGTGEALPGPFALVEHLPGLSRFWWPRRFLGVATAAGTGVVALLVSQGRGPWGPWGRAVVTVGLLLLELHELGPRSRGVAGGGAPHPLLAPAFFRGLGAAPGTAPVLQVPLLTLPNEQVLDQVVHRQALFGSLAQTRADLRPATLLAVALEEPFRHLLPGAPPPASPADLRATLAARGFHWVVLRRDLPGLAADLEPWALTRLGEPTLREGGLLAWDVGPSAAAPFLRVSP